MGEKKSVHDVDASRSSDARDPIAPASREAPVGDFLEGVRENVVRERYALWLRDWARATDRDRAEMEIDRRLATYGLERKHNCFLWQGRSLGGFSQLATLMDYLAWLAPDGAGRDPRPHSISDAARNMNPTSMNQGD